MLICIIWVQYNLYYDSLPFSLSRALLTSLYNKMVVELKIDRLRDPFNT
jgi:hypothetical protein